MTEQNTRQGIMLMIVTTFVFGIQDGLSRHLAEVYDVRMVVMIRYWVFALFALAMAWRQAGSIRAAFRTSQPILQALRALILIAEICVMIVGFVRLGLVESHAIFACYPLLVAALSGPILGEKVGWRRWAAIGVGFVGVMVILQPGSSVFSINMLWAAAASLMFAVYGLLTRYVGRKDRAITSFVWTGVVGAAGMTVVGLPYLAPMTALDSLLMGVLCMTALTGHYLLIRAYEVAEASAVQPFAYLQLPFASIIGIMVFGDILRWNVAVGAAIVVSAGVFTLLRERLARQRRH